MNDVTMKPIMLKLNLPKTSSSTGLSRIDGQSFFSGGTVSIDTVTVEKEIGRYSDRVGLIGILSRLSKKPKR